MGELHKIRQIEMTYRNKDEDRRRVIKSRMEVLSGKFSHTIISEETAAWSVFFIGSWWIGSEMRCFGDLEVKVVSSRFHYAVNHSPETHSAKALC
jgi:hypothetical protein